MWCVVMEHGYNGEKNPLYGFLEEATARPAPGMVETVPVYNKQY